MTAIRRVLAPTDFSDHSRPATRLGAEMAAKFGAELILLHVVQDMTLVLPDACMPTPVPSPDLEQLTAAAKVGLADYARTEGLDALNPRLEIRVGPPATEIVEAAKDFGADLIAIGTHGRTGLAHMVLGSAAEQIVRHASCPVLTVRSNGKPTA